MSNVVNHFVDNESKNGRYEKKLCQKSYRKKKL